ncbi:TetR/AcrR family transcriptional regulator [Pararhodobacter sp.]|uniref:TetR/AcrR family transcriptional regulator n=1 Tax=Pararhodobacter sp. TaxID=2127056 RepID=UPI002FDD86AC
MSDQTTPRTKGNTRQRLIDAAEAIARTEGPGAMSLDAVAAEAGVSKGGLLYHFPSKSKLLEAMVDGFLSRFDNVLQDAERSGRPNAVIQAFVQHFIDDRKCRIPPPSGLLAVIADDPGMLEPIQRHHRNFLNRIRANATDPDFAVVAFLAIQAVRNAELLNTEVLDSDEIGRMAEWLFQRLK